MGCSNNRSKYKESGRKNNKSYNNTDGKSLMSSSFINEKKGERCPCSTIPNLRRKRHARRHRRCPVLASGMKSKAVLAKGNDNDDEDGDSQDNDLFEGDPRPLPYGLEKELINKSNKHIRISEVFIPSNKVFPITSKFYAKYEQHSLSKAQAHRPRLHKPPPDYPLLESQMYGWIPVQCREAATYLNCMQAPKRRCCITIHGEQIIAGRITERPPFNGLQFILH